MTMDFLSDFGLVLMAGSGLGLLMVGAGMLFERYGVGEHLFDEEESEREA